MADTDMAGPLMFALVLGVCLLLSGKLHFGYIYGFGLLGCAALYLLVNLMAGAYSYHHHHPSPITPGHCAQRGRCGGRRVPALVEDGDQPTTTRPFTPISHPPPPPPNNSLPADAGHSMDLSRTVSVLGYCLLPMVLLAGVSVVVDLRGGTGAGLGIAAVLWCTQSATRFFEGAMAMRQQRYLIAYPTLLLYACFALITIF
jgi:hypothetical protein